MPYLAILIYFFAIASSGCKRRTIDSEVHLNRQWEIGLDVDLEHLEALRLGLLNQMYQRNSNVAATLLTLIQARKQLRSEKTDLDSQAALMKLTGDKLGRDTKNPQTASVTTLSDLQRQLSLMDQKLLENKSKQMVELKKMQSLSGDLNAISEKLIALNRKIESLELAQAKALVTSLVEAKRREQGLGGGLERSAGTLAPIKSYQYQARLSDGKTYCLESTGVMTDQVLIGKLCAKPIVERQVFKKEAVNPTEFILLDKQTSRCIRTSPTDPDRLILTTCDRHGAQEEHWRQTENNSPGTVFKLQNKKSLRCLNLASDGEVTLAACERSNFFSGHIQ